MRGAIGWCGPASHLFDSALRENLRLAAPDAWLDRLPERQRLGAESEVTV